MEFITVTETKLGQHQKHNNPMMSLDYKHLIWSGFVLYVTVFLFTLHHGFYAKKVA